MLCNFACCFKSSADVFKNLFFEEKNPQEYHKSVEQFGPRSGPTFSKSGSVSKGYQQTTVKSIVQIVSNSTRFIKFTWMVIWHAFCRLLIFSKLPFLQRIFRNNQQTIWPDLGSNCLQKVLSL